MQGCWKVVMVPVESAVAEVVTILEDDEKTFENVGCIDFCIVTATDALFPLAIALATTTVMVLFTSVFVPAVQVRVPVPAAPLASATSAATPAANCAFCPVPKNRAPAVAEASAARCNCWFATTHSVTSTPSPSPIAITGVVTATHIATTPRRSRIKLERPREAAIGFNIRHVLRIAVGLSACPDGLVRTDEGWHPLHPFTRYGLIHQADYSILW